jgi:hypothetical protein
MVKNEKTAGAYHIPLRGPSIVVDSYEAAVRFNNLTETPCVHSVLCVDVHIDLEIVVVNVLFEYLKLLI